MYSINNNIKMNIVFELIKLCTFRTKPLPPSLGSLYRYRNTKWNMVPSFTVATLYHLYTTDFRHPTKHNEPLWCPNFLLDTHFVVSSLQEMVSVLLPADT